MRTMRFPEHVSTQFMQDGTRYDRDNEGKVAAEDKHVEALLRFGFTLEESIQDIVEAMSFPDPSDTEFVRPVEFLKAKQAEFDAKAEAAKAEPSPAAPDVPPESLAADKKEVGSDTGAAAGSDADAKK